jgi:hypothetical protein
VMRLKGAPIEMLKMDVKIGAADQFGRRSLRKDTNL